MTDILNSTAFVVSPYEEEKKVHEQAQRRYCVGDCRSTEFGLLYLDKNTNIEIKTVPGLNQQPISKIIIDDRGYDSK